MHQENGIGYDFTESAELRFDKIFDEIIEMASKICESPIAFISILEKKGQHFRTGLGLNSISAKIEETICNLTLRSKNQYLEIEDLNEDPRTKNFSYVKTDEKLIHCVGVPISLDNDKKVGVLCTMDRKRKRLSIHQITALQILSKQTSILYELKEKDKILKMLQLKLQDKIDDLEYFISTASHDLKSPIKSIKSLLGLVVINNIELSSRRGEAYYDLINKSLENALDVVEGIAQYAKNILTEEKNIEIDLENMLNSIFELIIKNYPESKARLKLNKIRAVVSQKSLLRSLFENLIDNAFKYRRKEIDLLIEISQEKHDDKWIFTVSDNGIGIDEDNLKTIFKPFERLHTKSEYKGSGLGLASVNRIIQKFSGEIKVESNLGKGSKFIFSIGEI